MINNPFQSKVKQEKEVAELERMNSIDEIKKNFDHKRVLTEHGGLESNIPINHPYWRYRP